MKILLVNSLGYEAGGTETSLVRVKNELIKRGHDVKILTSDYNQGSSLFSDYTFKYPNKIFFQLLLRLFNPFSYQALKTVLKSYKPDIIHFHRMDFLSPSVLFLAKKYPTIMTIHGPEDFIKSLILWFLPHSFFKNNIISENNLNLKGKLHYFYHVYLQRPMYKIGLKNIDLFITPSKHFSKLIDQDITPIVSIPNGIKILTFSNKTNYGYKLLYVGRIDQTKGIDYAIKALPIILKKFPKTTFTIIGEGIFKEKLLILTKKLNLEKNITFVPWQKSNVVEQYYNISDIVLVPSIWPEPFGLVGPEAMSVGRPVIASKVGGIPEWLEDGKTGYLVDPGNEKQIAQKVIKLFSDKKLLKHMGSNARKKSEEFRIENYVNNIEKTYTKQLKNRLNN